MSMVGEWLDIGPVDQLPALGARTLPVRGGDEIAIFHTANGEVYALVNKCPHKQGPLSQGIVHDTTVTCPLHNWRISLITGKALGEDEGCVPVIPVKIDGGRILIGRAEALASSFSKPVNSPADSENEPDNYDSPFSTAKPETLLRKMD
jgi:nitrite reductase (NADH) small subunit